VLLGRLKPFNVSSSIPLSCPTDLPMSTTNKTAGPSRSSNDFTTIFQAALSEYEAVTRKPLRAHPFATQIDGCGSPEAVLDVLRTQSQAFNKFRKRNERLMEWLDPTVNILSAFSATLGEGIGLVSPLIHLVRSSSDIRALSHSHLLKRYSRGSAYFSW
jgi:hypothetical protein